MRFMQMPLLTLFVFEKVLTGKWGSSPAGRGPAPHLGGQRGGAPECGSCPWRAPGKPAPWPFHGAHPSVPSLPRYTLIPLEPALPAGITAASGGEAFTGGGAAFLVEQGSLSPNQRTCRPSVPENNHRGQHPASQGMRQERQTESKV